MHTISLQNITIMYGKDIKDFINASTNLNLSSLDNTMQRSFHCVIKFIRNST